MAVKYNRESLARSADLFGELQNGNVSNEFGTLFKIDTDEYDSAEASDVSGDVIKNLPLAQLQSYPRHHFVMDKGEDWESFVESIKLYGIMQPIIVRKVNDQKDIYQIIAGHRRTEGGREAGLTEIPAIVIEADDIEASILVGLTNKQRENISDIEWGFTYRETYELMKRQAGRPKENCGHRDHNLKGKKTLDVLAEKYGESAKTIQRKMRLTYLINLLLELFESKLLTQAAAVDLSYLTEKEQDIVGTVICGGQINVTPEIAKMLKTKSEEKRASGEMELDINDIYEVTGTMTEKKAVIKEQKFTVPDAYFPGGLKKKEKEKYILKALQYIQEHGISISEE